ncbi:hypothetical protein B9Z19DRAFT_1120598 [Tuber borchii]|uniref:Uncharacterized protein n=1 Tax=Tuber borchii TaxID=42251 RepID=A0A2T7A4A3_TUBBO|nr:hypothetical protein B9Z19DRAFT_1120598 [Tuber borchii]
MLPWGIAIDFTCQERLYGIVATATVLFPLIYGLVFMGCLRDYSVGLASTFLAVGLLVQQWDNSNEWFFWATVANAAVTGIFSIWAMKAQYDRRF